MADLLLEDLDYRNLEKGRELPRDRGQRSRERRAAALPGSLDDLGRVTDSKEVMAGTWSEVGSSPCRRPLRGEYGQGQVGAHRSWISPRTLPSGSVTVATRRPPPTSCAASFTVAPAAVTSASLASMSSMCQYATGEVMSCAPAAGTRPMCWPAASKPT